jgi:hypothetical protein
VAIALVSTIAAILVVAAQPSHTKESSERAHFIGTWELVATEDQFADGSKRPYADLGKDAKGYLIYATDGHMCAGLMNPNRPKWKDPRKPTDEEKASAMAGFTAYCGRYEIDVTNHVVYHYPEVAWMPNWTGTRQVRPYKLDGDILVFSDKATDQPPIVGYAITWRKLK